MALLNTLTCLAFKLFNRQLKIGSKVKFDLRSFPARGGVIEIGSYSVVRAGVMLLPSGGSIAVGARTSINQYVVINGHGGVQIGDDVMIAAFCAIFSSNHRFDRLDIPMSQQGMMSKGRIVIEDDVWIGAHAVILDGVTIGRGSVVAAGAVVNADIEQYSIVAGVPARLIARRKP
jgi:acetyltransferase-like isoleucine patch superfamily enzyme